VPARLLRKFQQNVIRQNARIQAATPPAAQAAVPEIAAAQPRELLLQWHAIRQLAANMPCPSNKHKNRVRVFLNLFVFCRQDDINPDG
jgi:hypothetical protein